MSDKDKPMFDAIEFYDLMQAYRIAPAIDQKQVTEAFEAVKAYIKAGFEQSRAELAEKDKRIAELEADLALVNRQWKMCSEKWPKRLEAANAKLEKAKEHFKSMAQGDCDFCSRAEGSKDALAELGDE